MPRPALLATLAAAVLLPLTAAPAHAAAKPKELYVSLGDSYAAGVEATSPTTNVVTRNGFAYQVPALAKARGDDLKLVNFGCGGATTTSILSARGCTQLGVGGVPYPGRTQLQAAESYLRRHRGQVRLVSVSIGGNDVTACAAEANPVPCVAAGVAKIRRNVTTLAKRLRRAAGPKVVITGITYPDVLLGSYLKGDAASQQLATLSVFAFRSMINPALKDAYAAGRGRFVDVTTATGAYTPFDQTTAVEGLGTLPVAVAKVCELTYFCQFGDIHARPNGYAIIARLVADTLPRRR